MSALRTPQGLLEEIPPFRSVSLSERTLMRGYGSPATGRGPVIRTEPCACGGHLELRVGDEVDELVADHNATIGHQAWSAQREA